MAATLEDETGGALEVTVWPDTFEQTQGLWETGTTVVAAVRVKSRDSEAGRDRLQLSVQRAVAYVEGEFDPSLLAAGNGNGNGRSRSPAEPPPGPPRLRIVLEETDDHDGDQERLRSLVQALLDYAGEGVVQLSIRQRDGEQVEMELPRARHCPELQHALSEIVGPWGSVVT
jgi:hypothetical protein